MWSISTFFVFLPVWLQESVVQQDHFHCRNHHQGHTRHPKEGGVYTLCVYMYVLYTVGVFI